MYLIIILIVSFFLLSSGDISSLKAASPSSRKKPILKSTTYDKLKASTMPAEKTVSINSSEINNFIKRYTSEPDNFYVEIYGKSMWDNLYRELKKINTSGKESVNIPERLSIQMRELDDVIEMGKKRLRERFST